MRFYDRLMQEGRSMRGFQNTFGRTLLTDVLPKTTVISADNVCEYFFAVNDKEVWPMSDFPNLAPPMDNFFIEMRHPSKIISNVHGVCEWDLKHRPLAWGILFSATRISADPFATTKLPNVDNSTTFSDYMVRGVQDIMQRGGGWLIMAMLIWGSPRNEEIEPTWMWAYGVDSTGKPMCTSTQAMETLGYISMPLNTSRELVDFVTAEGGIDVEENGKRFHVTPMDIATEMLGLLKPALLTLTFMNCKNVSKITHETPHALAKARQKRGRPPLCRYTTLRVHAFGERRAGSAERKHTGIEQGYHIVRGHFKTYTAEKPLLGRAVGTYWWALHAAGSKKVGVIAKDYEVETR